MTIKRQKCVKKLVKNNVKTTYNFLFGMCLNVVFQNDDLIFIYLFVFFAVFVILKDVSCFRKITFHLYHANLTGQNQGRGFQLRGICHIIPETDSEMRAYARTNLFTFLGLLDNAITG